MDKKAENDLKMENRKQIYIKKMKKCWLDVILNNKYHKKGGTSDEKEIYIINYISLYYKFIGPGM